MAGSFCNRSIRIWNDRNLEPDIASEARLEIVEVTNLLCRRQIDALAPQAIGIRLEVVVDPTDLLKQDLVLKSVDLFHEPVPFRGKRRERWQRAVRRQWKRRDRPAPEGVPRVRPARPHRTLHARLRMRPHGRWVLKRPGMAAGVGRRGVMPLVPPRPVRRGHVIATPFRAVDPGRLGALGRHGQRGGAIVVTGKRPIVRLRYTELKRGAGRDVGPAVPDRKLGPTQHVRVGVARMLSGAAGPLLRVAAVKARPLARRSRLRRLTRMRRRLRGSRCRGRAVRRLPALSLSRGKRGFESLLRCRGARVRGSRCRRQNVAHQGSDAEHSIGSSRPSSN